MSPLFELDAGGVAFPCFPLDANGQKIAADGKKYLTAEQAADVLGMSVEAASTMWRRAIGQFAPNTDAIPTPTEGSEASTLPPLTSEPSSVPAGFLARLEGFRRVNHPGILPELWRVFAEQCWTRQLDPVIGQIYPQLEEDERGGQAIRSIIGIDGLRLQAIRTQQHAGVEILDPDYDLDGKPWRQRVIVYRWVGDKKSAFEGRALWNEYGGRDSEIAMQYPVTTLERIAEAKALKRGFPAECGQLYIPEEMAKQRRGPSRGETAMEGGSLSSRRRLAEAPTSRKQLELALVEFKITDPSIRAALIERFRARHPGMKDEQLFAAIFRAVEADPAAFGGVVPEE